MDTISGLSLGFGNALSPANLGWALLGCFLGTAVGVLPGIGPALTIALLLPITFKVSATGAFILFCGVFYGAMYGGSTTSILLNTPGESGSIITALEGAKMARNGRAGPALVTAAVGSFIAGTVGTLGISFLGPILVELALKLGPAEYFCLMVLCFVTVSAVLGGSALRGLTSLAFGLMLGLVGVDLQTGQPRMTFGMIDLLDGIDVVLVAVALFAVGETLYLAWRHVEGNQIVRPVGRLWMNRTDWRRSFWPWIRGSALGFPFGVMPAGGTEMPTMLSYYAERRMVKPEFEKEFGTTGAIEGVAGPESANNAAAQTSFIPLLTLGIPANAVMALMVGALIIQGIQPGPRMVEAQPDLFWGLICSMWIGNLMLLVINLPLIGMWVKLLSVPYKYMYPAILMFCVIGVYSLNNSVFDVYQTLAFGILGYVFTKLNLSAAPLLIGFVLGPMMEEHLRRAMLLSRGDAYVFIDFANRPISASLLVICAIVLGSMMLPALRKKKDEAIAE